MRKGRKMLLVTLAAPIMILLLAAGKSGPASRYNETPPHGIVYNTRELSRIDFSCYFLDNRGEITVVVTNKITCDFRQVLLTMPSAEEVTQRLRKQDEDFEVGWKENFSKQPLTEFKKVCGKPEDKRFQESRRRRFESHKYAAALLPALERSQRAYDRLCSCADKACLHDALKASFRQEAQDKAETCKISSSDWKSEFLRNGEAWVSVDTQQRLFQCFSTVTTTLSQAKDSDGMLWNMRTVTVPNPNADPKFCPNTVEDNTHTWDSYDLIALTCRNIEL
jgi:hypothetical protein